MQTGFRAVYPEIQPLQESHFPHSNPEQGNYVTHIYAWDSSGNKTCVSTSIVYIDRTAPTLTDIKVVEKDSKGYTVECMRHGALRGGVLSQLSFCRS